MLDGGLELATRDVDLAGPRRVTWTQDSLAFGIGAAVFAFYVVPSARRLIT